MRTRLACLCFALAALVVSPLSGATSVRAQSAAGSASASDAGRVEFNHPGGGSPAVEIDLPAGLFGDVVGLGDAAIAGVAEGLLNAKTSDEQTKAGVKLATDQLAAIRSIIGAVKDALGDVHVRVYRGEDGGQTTDSRAVAEYYAQQLSGSAWNKIVSARDRDAMATVFLMRDNGAIRGVFVVASNGRELVLANVLCDVSPERVKQITHQATSMGIELGGEQAIKRMLQDLQH